jgi:dihydrofolate synthase/folylpolyglutamate synthase
MVDTALRAAGRHAARYTSPHLVRIEERFVIDGTEAGTDLVEASARVVRAAAEALVARGALPGIPTFFECTTALAFELFRSCGVDVAVVEVGLGGRLDATNVVRPLVTAIVSIDFDHQAQLGTTIDSIAREKAGIAKPGVPMVCGPLPAAALDTITAVCAEVGAPLIRADSRADLARAAALPLSLRGAHQIANAAVAWRVLEIVDGQGIKVDPAAITAGLTTARWPGRIELFEVEGVSILVDAAHNPAGARGLADYLQGQAGGPVTLVFGAMRDKAVAEMLAALAPRAREIICTTAPSPRAMPADEIAMLAGRHHRVVTAIGDPVEALLAAIARRFPVAIAGSIFLVGPLRERLSRGILR